MPPFAAEDGASDSDRIGVVGVLVLIAYAQGHSVRAVGWLAFGQFWMQGIPGLTFFKVLGSGRNAGFGIVPGFDCQGLFCAFRDEASADTFIAKSAAMRFYRTHARELFVTKLRAISTRGRWSGVVPLAVTVEAPVGSPIASLTRASIRPRKALEFWRHAAPSQSSLEGFPGCLIAAGLGEAPLLRQATFTVWENSAAMGAFSHAGAHLEAIRAARTDRHFSEDLFARYVPYDTQGTWKGQTLELAHSPFKSTPF